MKRNNYIFLLTVFVSCFKTVLEYLLNKNLVFCRVIIILEIPFVFNFMFLRVRVVEKRTKYELFNANPLV